MKQRLLLSAGVTLALIALALPGLAATGEPGTNAYLPFVFGVAPTPAAAPTDAPTQTPIEPTATPAATATPTPLPPSLNACRQDPNADRAPNYPVRIVAIDKGAETVTLRNVSAAPIDLSAWTMCSILGNQTHDGIGGALAAGATRTYSYTGPGNIWNNSERDDGALYDPSGSLVSYYRDR
jgi:hypothetical protein